MTHRGGLWPSVLDPAGAVDPQAWTEAAEAGQDVGTCRDVGCLGRLRPLAALPPDYHGLVWYEAECTEKQCGKKTSWHGPVPGKKTTEGKQR